MLTDNNGRKWSVPSISFKITHKFSKYKKECSKSGTCNMEQIITNRTSKKEKECSKSGT
jgi:hypothetical protein